MKVILTGPTGFIGQEVLHQCLQHPSITSVVALSRRELPNSVSSNPKLKVMVLNDFLSYPDNVLQEFSEAECCIWSIGLKPNTANNDETSRKVEIGYPTATANALLTQSAAQLAGKKFRFIQLSGVLSERDQKANLWFMQDVRRIKGEVENKLIEFAKQYNDRFETFVVKPAYVLSKDNRMITIFNALNFSVMVDELAAVMVNIALNGSKVQTIENKDLKKQGRALLKDLR